MTGEAGRDQQILAGEGPWRLTMGAAVTRYFWTNRNTAAKIASGRSKTQNIIVLQLIKPPPQNRV